MPNDDPSQLIAIRLTALGVPTEITLEGSRRAELLPAVKTSWSRCIELYDAMPVTTQARLRVLLDDDSAIRSQAFDEGALVGDELDVVMDALSRHLTLMAIGERQADLLMLHAAGVVEPSSGCAVVLVGPSGTGKTTAALTLGRTWAYLSDETVGIDTDQRAVPYPKPLSLIDDESPLKRQASPLDLGLAAPASDIEIGAVVLLDRRPPSVAALPTVEPVPTLEAVARLAEQTSCLRAHAQPLHRLADLIRHVGAVQRVTYSEASTLAPVLEGLVRR